MRDAFFAYYVSFGHALCYKRKYKISTRRIGNVYSGFLMLVSAGGIATLTCWQKYPTVWSIIVLLAQILQVLQPLTQAAKQWQALNYIIQDASDMMDEISAYWRAIERADPPISDAEIEAKIETFQKRMRDSERRFAGNIDFPFKKRLDEKAFEENARYFWYYYGVKPEKGDSHE